MPEKIAKMTKVSLLELFIEPGTGPSQNPKPADWQDWAAAMNSTISNVRNDGVYNTAAADGLAHAGLLTGTPTLSDTKNQIAYAAHPYTFNADEEKEQVFWIAVWKLRR